MSPLGLHKTDPLSENIRSMMLLDGVAIRLRARLARPLLLGVMSLAVGCVSLDKPPLVEQCAAKGSCSNEPVVPGPDAKDDAEQSNPDRRIVDEPVGGQGDLGPDNSVLPDASPDMADTSGGKQDVGGPEEVAAPGDVGAESIAVAEVGPDLGPDLGPDAGDKDDLVKEDVTGYDVISYDIGGPEAPRDLPTDSLSNCSLFYGSSPTGGSQGHPFPNGSKAAFCVATCDDIDKGGWNCSNIDGRTVTVNGTAVKCGDPITKKNGYFVFEVAAGTNSSFAIYWWVGAGTWASTCTAP